MLYIYGIVYTWNRKPRPVNNGHKTVDYVFFTSYMYLAPRTEYSLQNPEDMSCNDSLISVQCT